MEKRNNNFSKIILIFICVAAILICSMYYGLNKDKMFDNGFSRKFLNIGAPTLAKLSLDSKGYRFSSSPSDDLYIYDFTMPEKINKVVQTGNNELKLENHYIPKIKKNEGPSYVFVDTTTVKVINRYSAIGYKTVYGSNHYLKTSLKSGVLHAIENPSDDSFLIMVGEKKDSPAVFNRVLKKVCWNGKEIARFAPPGQGDSYFSNDGFFACDKKSNRIIYAFFYRGEFLCLDTNLNLQYKGNTIDTNRNVAIVQKKNDALVDGKLKSSYTLGKPPRIINSSLSLANDNIYMRSHLKADNESFGSFKDHYIFDVYSLKNGSYINSIQIPRIAKKTLTSFKVVKDKLYALYEDTMVMYKI